MKLSNSFLFFNLSLNEAGDVRNPILYWNATASVFVNDFGEHAVYPVYPNVMGYSRVGKETIANMNCCVCLQGLCPSGESRRADFE